MQVLEFAAGHEPITLYQSRGAFALPLADGRGEVHAKGSDSGMTAIMVQLTDLVAAPRAVPPQ